MSIQATAYGKLLRNTDAYVKEKALEFMNALIAQVVNETHVSLPKVSCINVVRLEQESDEKSLTYAFVSIYKVQLYSKSVIIRTVYVNLTPGTCIVRGTTIKRRNSNNNN